SGRFLLVGNGGFNTIQAALDEAQSGDTILLAAGTYAGNVTVNVANLTIKGAEPGVVIAGSFKSDNPDIDLLYAGSLADFLKSGHAYSQTAGSGIIFNANGATVQNVAITAFTYGLNFGDGIDGTNVSNVALASNLVGIKKGTTADISNFQFTNSSITDGLIGIDFDKDVTDNTPAHAFNGLADGIVIDTVNFTHLVYKGIYAKRCRTPTSRTSTWMTWRSSARPARRA